MEVRLFELLRVARSWTGSELHRLRIRPSVTADAERYYPHFLRMLGTTGDRWATIQLSCRLLAFYMRSVRDSLELIKWEAQLGSCSDRRQMDSSKSGDMWTELICRAGS